MKGTRAATPSSVTDAYNLLASEMEELRAAAMDVAMKVDSINPGRAEGGLSSIASLDSYMPVGARTSSIVAEGGALMDGNESTAGVVTEQATVKDIIELRKSMHEQHACLRQMLVDIDTEL